MPEKFIHTWLQQLITGKSFTSKRKRKPLQCWNEQLELLEGRQVLSAVMGTEELPPAVEVSSPEIVTMTTTSTPKGKHERAHGKAAPTYPNVTGTWNLTASVVLDGDPPIVFTGTVQMSQTKGKITGNVQLTGLPLFTIKGKLSKQAVNDLHGSTKFPVEISDGNFRGVKGKLDVEFAQGLQTFSGSVNRSIFGYTIAIGLQGVKQ